MSSMVPWQEAREGLIVLEDIQPATCAYALLLRHGASLYGSQYLRALALYTTSPSNFEWSRMTEQNNEIEKTLIMIRVYAFG
jgi:hypothetical protein